MLQVGEFSRRFCELRSEGVKLYVANLDATITGAELKSVFADCDGLTSARVIFDKQSGRSRGFGFVEFENAVAAEAAALRMDGLELDGRELRVSVASDD